MRRTFKRKRQLSRQIATRAVADVVVARAVTGGIDVWAIEEGDVGGDVEVGAPGATRGWGEVSIGCQAGGRGVFDRDDDDDDDDGDVRVALVSRGKGASVTSVHERCRGWDDRDVGYG